MLEKIFESTMWKTRFLVVLAVVFGLVGSLILFVVGSMDIWEVAKYTFETITTGAHPDKFHEDIVSKIIGAVDLYLIAIVMFIFAFGVYELFISKIDHAMGNAKSSKILAIDSLDQLKDIEYIPDFKCYQPFQRLVIDSNGKVMACANDQMSSVCIGDANTMTVHEIWHGKKMQEFRQDHLDHNAIAKHDICKQCKYQEREIMKR